MFNALLCRTTITSNGFRAIPKYNCRGDPISMFEGSPRHRAPQVGRRVIFRAYKGIDSDVCLLHNAPTLWVGRKDLVSFED
eukprot:9487350-Pyramimonas_sp.AAC.1